MREVAVVVEQTVPGGVTPAGMAAAAQRRAVVRGWQQAVDAALSRQQAQLDLPGGPAPQVSGGRDATSAPWMARLIRDGLPYGGAAYIGNGWLLTAKSNFLNNAGNAYDLDPSGYTFKVGNVDQTQGEAANAVKIVPNPDGDLALVKLDHDLQKAMPVQLGDGSMVGRGTTVQVYGWGATDPQDTTGATQSQQLRVADLTVTSTHYIDPSVPGEVTIQAVRGDGMPGTGDLGGPMMVTGPDGRPHLVGVSSYSAVDDSYAAYANITDPNYRKWIDDTTAGK